jgi:hypothetical protein
VNRLILRLLRPYLIVALLVTAAATTYLFVAAATVQRRLDAQGVPDCVNPNVCWPTGAAMDAILGAELVAAFTPLLLGLLVGVPLFARERQDGTAAFVLTQSVPARRWALAKLAWAAGVAGGCTAVVAVTHRLVMARYTLLANDLYELLELLHHHSVPFMVMLSVATAVTAGVLGLVTGRTSRTVASTVLWWPFGVIAAHAGGGLLSVPLAWLPWEPGPTTEGLTPQDDRYWTADLSLADGVGYVAAAALAVYVLVVVLLGRRLARRAAA